MFPRYEFHPDLIADPAPTFSGSPELTTLASGQPKERVLTPLTVTTHVGAFMLLQAVREPNGWRVYFVADGEIGRHLPDDRQEDMYVAVDGAPIYDNGRLPYSWGRMVYWAARKWILAGLLSDAEIEFHQQWR